MTNKRYFFKPLGVPCFASRFTVHPYPGGHGLRLPVSKR